MFRMIGAILAGYLTMMILVGIVTALLANFMVPSLQNQTVSPPVWYMLVNLAYSSVFAAVGGFVTASIAPPPRFKAALMLASLMFIMSIIYLFSSWGGIQPWWYLIALVILGPPAAAYGGYLRAGQNTR